MANDNRNQYEAMFLFGPLAANDLDAAIDLTRQMIERHDGEVLVLKKWDERRLTYEIAGQKRGTFIIAYFNAPGGAVAAIERDVQLSEQVLRILITRADHLNREEMEAVEPQPIEPRPERRDDRPGYRDDRPPREERAQRPRREEEQASEPAASTAE